MTVLDYHHDQSSTRFDSVSGARRIGGAITITLLAFMALAAVTAPASETDPQGWHGNSADMRPLER